jgi:hypothetical protein
MDSYDGPAGASSSALKHGNGFEVPFEMSATNMESGLFDTTCTGDVTPCAAGGEKTTGQFYQDVRSKAMTIFSTTNTGESDWSFKVQNTDGSGVTHTELKAGAVTGYILSNCGPARAANSMHHLFILDSTKSPNAAVSSGTTDGGGDLCGPFTLPIEIGAPFQTSAEQVEVFHESILYQTVFGVTKTRATSWMQNAWAADQTGRMSCWNGGQPQLELVNGGLAVFADIEVSIQAREITLRFTGAWIDAQSGAAMRVLLPTLNEDGNIIYTASCSLSLALVRGLHEFEGSTGNPEEVYFNYAEVTGPPVRGSAASEIFAVFEPSSFSRASGLPSNVHFAFTLTMDLSAASAATLPAQPAASVGNGDPVSRANTDPTGEMVFVDRGLVFAAAGTVTAWDLWASSAGEVRMQVWERSDSGSQAVVLACENVVTVAAAGRLTWQVPAGEECSVEAGDLVGWYAPASGCILVYDQDRAGCAVGDAVRAARPSSREDQVWDCTSARIADGLCSIEDAKITGITNGIAQLTWDDEVASRQVPLEFVQRDGQKCPYGPPREVLTSAAIASSPPSVGDSIADEEFTVAEDPLVARRTYSVSALVTYTGIPVAEVDSSGAIMSEYEQRWELCLENLSSEIRKNGAHVVSGVGPASPLVYISWAGTSGACLTVGKKESIFAEALKVFDLEGLGTRCSNIPGNFPAKECEGVGKAANGGGKFQISECLASGFGECAASCGGACGNGARGHGSCGHGAAEGEVMLTQTLWGEGGEEETNFVACDADTIQIAHVCYPGGKAL